jgi:hypothetical protein
MASVMMHIAVFCICVRPSSTTRASASHRFVLGGVRSLQPPVSQVDSVRRQVDWGDTLISSLLLSTAVPLLLRPGASTVSPSRVAWARAV